MCSLQAGLELQRFSCNPKSVQFKVRRAFRIHQIPRILVGDDGPEDPSHGPLPSGATTKAVLEQHQKDIKKDIEKLYDLATQLKTEVEKTDSTSCCRSAW